ncbi:MAG: SDR family oxidoreductase [Acidobacteriales bacterium]|nr:SDR family oxidoreductase [Terriglobales bacterium]
MVAPAYFAAVSSKRFPTALITGASGGIGYELARCFARDGWGLALVARDKAKLDKVADELRKLGSPLVTVMAKDLAELESPDEIFQATERAGLQIDALVNNAGFGWRGDFVKQDLDDILDMVQVNIVALTHLTRLYLPQMVARKSGRILNVASTAAFQPGPLLSEYYATKSFVLFLSEGLYEELRGTGVTVTCLCPGATHTGFAARAAMTDSKLFKAGAADARKVAEAGYRAMRKGKAVVITGFVNRLVAQSVRLGPRWLVRKITKWISE